MRDEVLMAVVEEPEFSAQAPPDPELAPGHDRLGRHDDEVEAEREFRQLTVFISASDLEAMLADDATR